MDVWKFHNSTSGDDYKCFYYSTVVTLSKKSGGGARYYLNHVPSTMCFYMVVVGMNLT